MPRPSSLAPNLSSLSTGHWPLATAHSSWEPAAVERCSDRRRACAEGRRLEETEFVTRAQRGDVDAYETLVRRYQDVAFRTAFLITGSADEAEDASQEALTKAYYALPRFRSGAPFRPWLLQIVANEARNRRKAAGRRLALSLRADSATIAGAGEPSPEAAVEAAEARAALLSAVNGLREEDRLVIACRYFLDLSEQETSTTLGIPRGTVKSRLSRALGRLRARVLGDSTAGGMTDG